MENIRFRKPVRAGDRLSGPLHRPRGGALGQRPTLGKVLGRTELIDEAGDVVYQMDGWGLIGRRSGGQARVHPFVSGGSYPPPP